jgi:MinD-like ATPase involved in chromosome partitioning or flagellar assembly
MAIIAVTGCSKAGKSTVISNLAATLTQEGKAVACLPCDWRYPSLSKHFGVDIPAEKSIGNIAKGAVPWEVFADCPRGRSLFVAGISDGENCFSHEPPESKGLRIFSSPEQTI